MENYHENINHFSLYIKNLIDTNFKGYKPCDPNYKKTYQQNFFNMKVIYHIHEEYNGIIYENISEIELYNTLNLKNTVPHIKIKDKRMILYLIFRMQNDLLSEEVKKQWLHGILKEINITERYYKSKYKAVIWSNSSKKHEEFAESIDTLFKNKLV